MKVKICGITHPDDAKNAAGLGADYIGIIFSSRSKRQVSIPLAKNIASTAKQLGAEPIGVFVDETIDQIVSLCEQTKINKIQLHGLIPQQALHLLLDKYSIIYTISVEKNGEALQQLLPPSVTPLFDHLVGGTGIPFDWSAFSPPKNIDWILAGGLNPSNVAKAINLLNPHGVDVSSGVEFPDRTRKDPVLVKAFIQAAKQSKEKL